MVYHTNEAAVCIINEVRKHENKLVIFSGRVLQALYRNEHLPSVVLYSGRGTNVPVLDV